MNDNLYIKSPLNYTGGKSKLLKQIMPLFPTNISDFIEPFVGGLNVGINVSANKLFFNDINWQIIELYKFIANINIDDLLNMINETIFKYDLSITNEKGFSSLRNDRNLSKDNGILLFLLICFGFNHQIRFNKNGDYNIPFGKNRSSYNKEIEKNLIQFSRRLKEIKHEFYSLDFSCFFDLILENKSLTKDSFIYVDPPYLITMATYNDIWNESQEKLLLDKLDSLNEQGLKFALSNVIEHNGRKNELLIEWSKKYQMIILDKNYKNCNYHKKTKTEKTIEVLIKNY